MPYVDFDPDIDFDLDFVNARMRDGTNVKVALSYAKSLMPNS